MRYQVQGELVRDVLQYADISTESIAELVGVSRDTILRLATRVTAPAIGIALGLERFLGVPVAIWLDGNPSKLEPQDIFPSRPGEPLNQEPIHRPTRFTAHGELLRELIRERGDSINRAAQRLDTSRSGLRHILKGQEPSAALALLAERLYGMDRWWWIRDSPGEAA